jgi:RecB family exonuclease
MSTLPPDFIFSQSSLQDYVDCPRRFQLRHLLNLAWPAVEAEPADEFEIQVALGQAFHRMVHQHLLGLEPSTPDLTDALSSPDEDPRLATWWEAYLAYPLANLPSRRYPEITLSAAVGETIAGLTDESGHRLIAKYDLIAVDPGRRAVIVDWKTSERRPTQAWLAGRLQTRVYRYLLVRAGAHQNAGVPILPEQVAMVYWFANYPEDPERLSYDTIQFNADAAYLSSLAAEIRLRDEDDFPLTTEVKRCLFCPYRSLCGRGIEAGELGQADDEMAAAEESAATDWAASFDFEQVGEIAF